MWFLLFWDFLCSGLDIPLSTRAFLLGTHTCTTNCISFFCLYQRKGNGGGSVGGIAIASLFLVLYSTFVSTRVHFFIIYIYSGTEGTRKGEGDLQFGIPINNRTYIHTQVFSGWTFTGKRLPSFFPAFLSNSCCSSLVSPVAFLLVFLSSFFLSNYRGGKIWGNSETSKQWEASGCWIQSLPKLQTSKFKATSKYSTMKYSCCDRRETDTKKV